MSVACAWATIIVGVLSLTTNPASAQLKSDQLKIISDFANAICQTAPLSSTSSEIELTGDAKAKLAGLVKKLADFGVEGAIKYKESSTFGVLQKDLASSIVNGNSCRQDISKTLLPQLFKQSYLNESAIARLANANLACREANFDQADRFFDELIAAYPTNRDVAQAKRSCDASKRTPVDIEISLLVSPSVFVKGRQGQLFQVSSTVYIDEEVCDLLSNTNGPETKTCSVLPGRKSYKIDDIILYTQHGQKISSNTNCGGFVNISESRKQLGILMCFGNGALKCNLTPVNQSYQSFTYGQCPFGAT